MELDARALHRLLTAPLVVLALGCSDRVANADAGGSSSSADVAESSGTSPASTTSGEGPASADDDSSGAGLDTSSSSGVVPNDCGDGNLDEGELCDDGNLEEGDRCHADCTPAFEVAWTALHDGSASAFDTVNDLQVDAAGNVVVLGVQRVEGQGGDVWMQQYGPDGREGWSFGWQGAAGEDDYGSALALASDGDLLVAGSTDVDATDSDILLLRVDARTQAIEWTTIIDGPEASDDESDSARGVAPTSDGGAVLVGGISGAGGQVDIWVARVDEAGNELWSASHDGPAHEDDRGKIAMVAADGGVMVFGNEDVGDHSSGIVLAFDGDGVPQPVATHTFDFVIAGAALAAGGDFVLVGSNELGNTELDVAVRKYDQSFAELWALTYDGSLDTDFSEDVHVDAAGNVYVAATTFVAGEQANALLLVYDGDGNPLWSDTYNNADIDLGDQWLGVRTDANGDVIVGGYSTVFGHDADGLVRKYHPL